VTSRLRHAILTSPANSLKTEFSGALYPTSPSFLSNVRQEAEYQIRRINHHPSLALWAGNNEIELGLQIFVQQDAADATRVKQHYETLFLDVLLHAVYDNSRSISYSPSSTTNGYVSLNHSAPSPMVERYIDLSAGSIYGDSGKFLVWIIIVVY
jgi:beta-mannosidase